MRLLVHGGCAAVLAATVALVLPAPARGQAFDGALRGSIEETDALADRFGEPPENDPDASENPPAARLLPEDAETSLSGDNVDGTALPGGRERRVRDERGRLVPSRPGVATFVPQRPPLRAIRTPQVGTPQPDGSSITRANLPGTPVQSGTPAAGLPSPYEPLGLRLGPLRVTTVVEQSFGATSNAEFKVDGEGSGFSETRLDVVATSDLPVHELRGRLAASYREFFADAPDLPTVDAEAAFRYDLGPDTTVTLDANYRLFSESATDDSLLGIAGTAVDRPLVQTGAVSLEAARTGGRLFGSLRGSIGREVFGDIEFADGSSRSQFQRDATLFVTALRLGYAHTPAFQPFIEGEIGYRVRDEELDVNGQNRDALRTALRVGVLVDLEERLTGSLAAGVERIDYDDAAFDSLTGPSVEAGLTWTPDALTRIGLTAATIFDDSVTFGLGGTLDYRLGLSVERDLRDNLLGFANANATISDPSGELEETTFALEGGLTWSLNRALALTGRLGYLRVESALANADYDVKSASLGLRWQK